MRKLANKGLLGVSLLTVGMVMGAPSIAFAQDEADQAEEKSDDTIIVRGQRREQSLLDVPISVTVFDDEYLTRSNAQDAKDFLLETPNVSFKQGGRNGAREILISIRGVSELTGAEKVLTQSPFSTFYDEFSAGTLASGQANLPLYDIESVEVLRGPQGIYFGRNSEAGAINITTKKPTDEYYGRMDAGIGRFNTYELSGVANVPLTDNLFARVTVTGTKTDGPIKNAHPIGGDTGADFVAMRGQIRWLPTEQTTVDFSVNHTIDNQDYTPKLGTCIGASSFGLPWTTMNDPLNGHPVNGGIGCYDYKGEFARRVNLPVGAPGKITLPAGVSLADFPDNTRYMYMDTREFTDNRADIVTLRIQHDFSDTISLVSITGASRSDQDQFLDLDHSGLKAINRFGLFETNSWSEEVRLSQNGAGFLDWTVGGLYYEEGYDAVNQILIEEVLGPWVPGDKANENIIHNNLDGWAVFANVEAHLSEAFSVQLGGRYSEDNALNVWEEVYAACGRRAVPAGPLSVNNPADPTDDCQYTPEQARLAALNALPQYSNRAGGYVVTGGRYAQIPGRVAGNSSSDFSPRIALNFNPNDDLSLYASVSKGYKPGGGRGNPDGGGATTVFDKEVLWNYEVGGNAYLFDRVVQLNGAIFWMDWRDYQVTNRETFCVLADGSRVNVLLVPDLAVCTGGQLQADATVNAEKARLRGFELSMKIRPTEAFTFGGQVGFSDGKFIEGTATVGGAPLNLAGARLGPPRLNAGAFAQYEFPVFGGDMSVRGDWNYRSDNAQSLVQQVTQLFPTKIDSFGLFNIRIGQRWGNHAINLNIENVANKRYFTASEGFSFVGPMLSYNPRTWSIRWTSEFGPGA